MSEFGIETGKPVAREARQEKSNNEGKVKSKPIAGCGPWSISGMVREEAVRKKNIFVLVRFGKS